MNIKISKGKTWPDSYWKRWKYNNFVGFTFRNQQIWETSIKFSGSERFTIKLLGFSEIRPFSWKRVSYDGWGQLLSFTHEDSDRIICSYNGDDKVSVSTYAYRRGLGPSTNSDKAKEADFDVSKKLGSVRNGEKFRVRMGVKRDRTVYEFYTQKSGVWSMEKEVSISRRSKSLARFWTYAHASGYHGSTAPSDVNIELDRI